MPAATDITFAPIAQQVARRVALRRWLGWLGRTLWIAVGGIAALALVAIISGSQAFSLLAWIALAAWLLAPLAYIFWQRPGSYSVLALWDQAAGRREAFASAWWFEQQQALTEAQQAHIDAQRAILPEAQTALFGLSLSTIATWAMNFKKAWFSFTGLKCLSGIEAQNYPPSNRGRQTHPSSPPHELK